MKIVVAVIAAFAAAPAMLAQLTPEQRVQDLQTVAGMYAKRYAPANWKAAALGVNVLDLVPWIQRARAAKNDLEYAEVLMEYVASFQDTHSSLSMTATFVASLGFFTDLYDGKVLIDLVDRSVLPARDYPFTEGDELVTLDGRPALEVGQELARFRGAGNPRAGLRLGIQRITSRSQSAVPRAVDVGDEAVVEIRRASGELQTYRLKWNKSGFPIRTFGQVPSPIISASASATAAETTPDAAEPAWRKVFYEMHMASDDLPELRRENPVVVNPETGQELSPRGVLNYGSRFMVWNLPAGFTTRLGRLASDVFYTGVYQSEGQRIGYLRLGSFPTYTTAQLIQLEAEIAFFNANTDGLVIDVMRNTGGTICSASEIALRTVPGSHIHPGLAFRPTISRILAYDNAITQLRGLGAPSWSIELYTYIRNLLAEAYNANRGMPGPIPICDWEYSIPSIPAAYRKPLIVLVDDFSTSTGDYFPALMQDNKRGKIVGMRTNGAGGSVIDVSAGWYSETNTRVTESLMVRLESRNVPGFPVSPYVENVGVRPDIELDYMTRDNLVTAGRPFVEAFTKIIVDEIKKATPTP
ncbi:MAG: S41 family peptidase [Acidobacteria bacterium]|nr:S41 family peptidase [Acidobacteriota bacterium]